MFRSEFLALLTERGHVHQITDPQGLDALAAAGGLVAYVGYDCTAPSLHVGNLATVMLLRRLQQTGGRPIVLLGGGTTKVGDPSGRDEARRLMDDAEIAANKASIRRAFERFLRFGDGPSDALLVDNAEWLDGLSYIPFLREVGRHISVNAMLARDSVRLRLERDQPLSFLEFNYMVLQAYDFVELARRFDCRLQMGGSDQWGNIVAGVDLARRLGVGELYGLTTPLITTADGAKMGKTARGAVWLDPALLSDWDYWQFWRNTADADVGRFLRLFTDLPLADIARLEALQGAEINAAKVVLADAATALCRGEEAARRAHATAEATFTEGRAGEGLPTARLALPAALVDALVATGLAASKGEARRKIAERAVRVDGEVVTDPHAMVAAPARLSVGRKRHALLDAA
ncbi:MAG: tyrosine--tRNA ligase [Sphingomonadaceae bacterium]|uniref:tyrosine--tRNA ligase n=1 Tax=Thermaurantiacus sp. TaxID=2820283 RepID=UPI00298EE935|nr:tyrosine--tRNA ligase [Thermaurantiacus sp.]MCS6986168.1 tyrosine--tRNA ligase [Sphingomonadaceae bacterium]MDW8414606.1 tyrosine--tRNA ligase [Thermaurantiacus sp.]